MISIQIPIVKILEEYIRDHGLTVTQFAERCALNTGTLSNLIHGYRPLSIRQLDMITKGMGKPEGALYELYIDEYIVSTPPNWRRVGPFLFRCAELGKLDCLQRVALFLTERLMYLPMLFNMAEGLLADGFPKAAVILYENVAEGERFQHSERLALCRFRLFTLKLGEDQRSNLKEAHKFEIFVDRLEIADQLDALKQLADVYASLHYWEQVQQLAGRLETKAKIGYTLSLDKQPERPVLYYMHYAYLLQAAVYDAGRDYMQALYYTSLYKKIGENVPLDQYTEEERKVIIQFQEWACANSYVYRLMSGEQEVLGEYIEFVASHPNEIPTALYMILQAANQYRMNIDEVLDRFEPNLSLNGYEQQSLFGKLNPQITEERHASFQAELAEYFLRTDRARLGLNYVLASLETYAKIRNEHSILRCVGLFEQYRDKASPAQCLEFNKRIREVQKHEKKVDSLDRNR